MRTDTGAAGQMLNTANMNLPGVPQQGVTDIAGRKSFTIQIGHDWDGQLYLYVK